MKDLFTDGYVDHAIFQPAYLGEFYCKGFGQTEEASELAAAHPGQADLQPQLRSAQRRDRSGPATGGRRTVRHEGREALHRGVARRVARLEARRPVGVPLLRGVPGTGYPQHPRPQGPDHPAAGPRRIRRRRCRPRRVGLHRPQFIVEHAVCRGWRTSAGSPPRNPTCTPDSRSRCRSSTPGRSTSRRSSANCCTGSARTASSSPRTTRYGRRAGSWRGSSTSRSPRNSASTRITTEQKKKILGLNAAKMYDIPVPAELQLPPRANPRSVRAAPTTDRGGLRWAGATRAYAALGTVIDPELDEPITDLGFVRSLACHPSLNVKVHLRLPTSFCSPNFAYLMASDAKDVLPAGLDAQRRGRAR